MSGFRTLLYKELLRFWKVSFQTIAAPILAALLYLLIFSHALESRVQVYPGVAYTAFLVPGLAMMSLLQNAFANSSSSLIQSKITGNIIFVLLTPLSPLETFLAYVLAAVVRGLAVGVGVLLVTAGFADVPVHHPLWALAFAFLGGGDPGRAGDYRGNLGGQIRPAGGVPELRHHPAHVSGRGVLFGPFSAAVLAGRVASEPVFLHGRRLSLRFLRRRRRRLPR